MKTLHLSFRGIILFLLTFWAGSEKMNAQTTTVDFTWAQTAPNTIQFTNTSSLAPSDRGPFDWHFSVTNPIYPAEQNWDGYNQNPQHIYFVPGKYLVTLLHWDTLNANAPDSITHWVTVTGTVICGLQSAAYWNNASCTSCRDGSASAYNNLGAAPFTFSWTNGASTDTIRNLAAGQYICTITDSLGCKTTDTASVGGINAPCSINFTYSVSPNWLMISDNSTGLTSANQLHWTASLNNQPYTGSLGGYVPAGHYYVCEVVTDSLNQGGCTGSYCDSILVPGNPPCQAAFSLTPDPNTPGNYTAANNTYDGGSPIYRYIWTWGDSTRGDTIATPTHTYSSPGQYQICLSINTYMGCTSTFCDNVTATRYAASATGTHTTINVVMGHPVMGIVEETKSLNSWSLFPNPGNEVLHLEYNLSRNSAVDIKIYNLIGQEVMLLQNNALQDAGTHRVDAALSELNAGSYLVRIITEGHSETKKLAVIR
ncbi:MAG TPA: T9SS type A sorting domain-containing protein [Bacteroidia bacterium]|jgi:PKD repeat protein|nr:T9SS type A sorting domain-containing protein [Bacteroidia bacterium]